MQSEIEIKTERLKKMLAAENLSGVLINAQHNFAWATGGKSNRINASVENGACFLFVRRDGKRFVLANNIEMRRLLAEEISPEDFEAIEYSWQDEKSSGDFVFEKARTLLTGGGEIASDLALNPKFRAIENRLAPLRFELTAPEIERYRRLGRDAGRAVGEIFETLAPGETEIEIAGKTESALAGFNIQSIVTLVGADERIEKYRHPTPTGNVWKKILLIAVCARREGLIANLSRIACTGEIPPDLRKKTGAVAQISARIMAATRAGTSGAQIYQTAAEAYAAAGFAAEIDKHHQGGATGYKTREWVAHPRAAEVVVQNQAFAWNPTVTGTKAEETFLVDGDEKAEILTASENFPKISVEIDGIEYFSPDILSL